MNPLRLRAAERRRRRGPRRRGRATRQVHRRRHQPRRPDEGERRAARARLVDINRLPLDGIEETDDGGLRIGALVTNTDVAYDARVEARYPLLSRRILAGAAPQLRNAATNGGNLLQRTRCYYFYDTATPCNKREPGAGCGAIGGVNRIHAILGASEHCIATHPSDMCVALAALEAAGARHRARRRARHPLRRLPPPARRRRRSVDTTLGAGELITAVDLPAEGFARHYTYLKLRDRLSYAFALVSVAAALRLDGGARSAGRARARRRRAQAVARPEAEATAPRARRRRRRRSARAAEQLLARRRGPRRTTTSRSSSPAAPIVRALRQAAAGTPQSQSDKRVA